MLFTLLIHWDGFVWSGFVRWLRLGGWGYEVWIGMEFSIPYIFYEIVKYIMDFDLNNFYKKQSQKNNLFTFQNIFSWKWNSLLIFKKSFNILNWNISSLNAIKIALLPFLVFLPKYPYQKRNQFLLRLSFPVPDNYCQNGELCTWFDKKLIIFHFFQSKEDIFIVFFNKKPIPEY